MQLLGHEARDALAYGHDRFLQVKKISLLTENIGVVYR